MTLRQPSLMIVPAALVLVTLAASAEAQQRGPGGFGGFSFASSLFSLNNDSVAKELELVPEQQEKIERLQSDMRNDMRSLFGELRDATAEERRERFAEFRENSEKALDDILLPQQRDRLAQIRRQLQLRQRGGGSSAINDRLADELELSNAQKEKLREVQEEVRAELREQIEKLQEEAREKVLGILTPSQKQRYEELIGERFELQRSDDGGRSRRFGRNRRGGRQRPESDN